MPQVIAAVLIGAGIAAGVKWLVKEIARVGDETRAVHDDMRQREAVRVVAKDLGKLEYDAETGVYRPARKH